MASVHKTVLLEESVDILDLKKGDIFVDGTVAGGGHSAEVCRRYQSDVKIIGIDVDEVALKRSRERFSELKCRITLLEGNFKDIDSVLREEGIASVDAVLLDLGWSTDQFETSGRGFSFRTDEPLLMTLGDPADYTLTARDLVNTLDADNLAIIIRNYGEEWNAKRIASAIVETRKAGPIETSGQLAEIVASAVGRRGKIHPATKTFQALRIAVNDELDVLKRGIEKVFEILSPGGRLAIITFHSLEDRIVKRAFKELSKEHGAVLLTKKPIRPGREEVTLNPRSRSSKLRALKK